MNKTDKLNNILDACLESLSRGETMEQCLTRYPEQSAELEPFLRTAAETRQAMAITPSKESKMQGWQQLSEALKETRPARDSIFSYMPRWAVAVAALIIIFIAGGATAGAAVGSLPDSFLYPVKLTNERVRLSLTFTQLYKTELLVKLADLRVREITAMAENDKPDKMAAPARRLDELLTAVAGPLLVAQPAMMESFSSPPTKEMPEERTPQQIATTPAPPPAEQPLVGESSPSLTTMPPQIMGITSDNAALLPPEQVRLVELIRRYQTENPEKLQAVLDKAPPETRALLESIIARYHLSYQQVLDTWQPSLP